MRISFTLIELVMIIVIIAILASIAVPFYLRAAERSRNREAQAMLELLSDAQAMHRLEAQTFVACSDAPDCNSQLALNLPFGANRTWDYAVTTNAAGNTFTATAARVNPPTGAGRTWSMNQDDDEPSCSPSTSKYCE
ncbi:MAG: hypothetical protein JW734_03310 [Candidatus Omnitrophica bacterium]|nr:hypothetical protein [Candidatus Omnitrophota bacterium]